jgi:hypothetical protein
VSAYDGTSNLDALPSNLILHGAGSDSLIVNDRPNQNIFGLYRTSPTFTITAAAVTRSNVVQSFSRFGFHTSTYTTTIGYSGMSSLEIDGGSSGNAFNLNSAPNNLTIHGGGGNNTLNYSGYNGDVLVDLPLGIATGVSGGISNIQNVVGSQGNSILVGNGGNVLNGGTGRNLLIAGETASTLVGNSGEDILVGGTTNYDTSVPALEALMAEWTRTDLPYAVRVQDLLTGGGFNGSTLLNVAEFHSNGGNNTLTGAAGLDLFYGLLPSDSSTPDKTDWDATQGEIFIDPNGVQVGIRIDATKLTAPTLLLDGTQTISDSAPQWLTLQPGTHLLEDATGYGSLYFTVNNDGTVSYDPALQGILSGQGSNQLTVNGATVTVDATALQDPNWTVDYRTNEQTTAPFTLYLLPGTHELSNSSGSVSFTVNPDGTLSYPSSEDALLSLEGSMILVVKALD